MVKNIKLYHSEFGVNDNVDVEVLLDNGDKYTATFFTLTNIHYLFENNKKTGECHNGLYFWAANMILVKSLSEGIIKEVIYDLLKTGEFFSSFLKID
ncbi:hypothetical protein [Metakosakonia massiliensis]|uniref:Uncharacterized protein n=1 Tax=Phytobacter massiliensis TaxID=1485952 RepID=A0A6N3AEE3_9ENTR|nr:hypothetical protein [Phytobacter massiliensis]